METRLTFQKYNEALKENRLLGLKCLKCTAVTTPPKMVCRKCGDTELDIVELSGRGTIQTFTTAFVAAEGRDNEVPYTIVLVELDEGPWIMGNLTGIKPDKVTMDIIDRQVRLGNRVFPGDKYSAGDSARPVFSLED